MPASKFKKEKEYFSKKRVKAANEVPKTDSLMLFTIFLLVILGLVLVYDVSVVYAYDIFGDKYYFLMLQFLWMLVGFFAFFVSYKTSYKNLLKLGVPLFFLSVAALIFVLLPTPFAPVIYGARRWIYLNPEPFPLIPFIGRLGFQPSELIKLPWVLYLALFLSGKNKENDLKMFKSFGILILILLALILKQPDFGTALVIAAIGVSMFFVSGASIKWFLVSAPLVFFSAIFFIFSSDYRRQRFMTFVNLQETDATAAGYHINQILIALGSGGIFGVGIGQSRQKYLYIPEIVTDSIFAPIGEEFGFIGTTILVLLFVFVIYRGYNIAKNCLDLQGQLIATGIITWFAIQSYINLSGMVHLIPLTGVPLPLISYGGSALVMGMFSLGVLLNISKNK